ncbi:MAG TPA: 2-oxo-4-hydroxy-4-carboxy-5-ureidoimidazoline decarboxylase [Pyrinomonadaceae bacterium]|nr:2-oxo-4-hydroxy-4-carboxy-5-ureidoimidazoline decarboxylase [Pyrinomonadaceae bacterium]
MAHDLTWLNELSDAEAADELLKCCGSKEWAHDVASGRPYDTLEELIATASDIWWSLKPNDWLEAFRSHPKIGEKQLAAPVPQQSRDWSSQEQAGIASASRETSDEMARLNREYEQKFGFIFIICASGKSPEEVLSALRERLKNDPEVEVNIAAAEQHKITELRLKKLLSRG